MATLSTSIKISQSAVLAASLAACSPSSPAAQAAPSAPSQQASETNSTTEQIAKIPMAERLQNCKSYSDLARTIMRGRQIGVDMAKVMEHATDPAAQELVMIAYDRPRMNVEVNQEEMTNDFGNEAYLECAKAARSTP
jgi:hypothetical protein